MNDLRRVRISEFLSVVICISIAYLAANFFYRHYAHADLEAIARAAKRIFVPHEFLSFQPEPAEKSMFLFSIVFFPLGLLGFCWLSYRLLLKLKSERILHWVYLTVVFAAALLFYAVTVHAIYHGASQYRFDFTWNHWLTFVCFLGLVAYFRFAPAAHEKIKRTLGIILFTLPFVPIVIVASASIFDIGVPGAPSIQNSHFGSVFPPVAAVYLGEAMLVNTYNQYGMYAHFLEPVFRLIGLSVLTFTSVMAFLILLQFGLLALFLKRFLRNPAVAFAAVLGLLFYNYLVQRYCPGDPYFQNIPIRMIFSAVLVYLSWRYFETNNRGLYWISFFLYSAAVVWNPETGLTYLTIWVLALAYNELLSCPLKTAVKRLGMLALKSMVIFSTVIGVFAVYIRLRYGAWPDLVRAFDPYILYSQYGYYMLPMPKDGLWQIPAFVYIAGMSYAMAMLIMRKNTVMAKMIFLISLLGGGLFGYYQGRSDFSVLWKMAYPATLLAAIAADNFLADLRKNWETVPRAAVLAGLCFFLAYGTGEFTRRSNWGYLAGFLKTRTYPALFEKHEAGSDFARRAEFIRRCLEKFTNRGDPVVLMVPDEGLQYLKLGIPKPWNGPGMNGTFRFIDLDRFHEFLMSRNCAVFIDYGYPWMEPYFHAFNQKDVYDRYEAVATNGGKGIVFFIPRTRV